MKYHSETHRMIILKNTLQKKNLNSTATLDAKAAYADADFVVIVAPTNVYSTNRIDVAFHEKEPVLHTN